MNDIIKKERLSNIELLRLLAMFLVLVVHADFFSLGTPTQEDVISTPASAFLRFFFKSLSIVCVNVFVLISGWFGIRPSVKGFCNFIFQCLFFLVGIYIVMLIFGLTSLSAKGIAGCLVLLKWNWFIKAYMGLYILSPVLNTFINNTEKKTFKKVLISFFAFQTIYSWVSDGAAFFENGYSTLSFMGLYLLARYTKIYLVPNNTPSKRFIYIYGIITLLLTLISFMSVRMGISVISGKMFSYVNPMVIISALSMLLYFNGLKIKGKLVNWLAASSFAIFLLHTNPNLCEPYFKKCVLWLYDGYDGITCLWLIFTFLLAVGMSAILIDQIRKKLWRVIVERFFN